jgi:hypothetical protein
LIFTATATALIACTVRAAPPGISAADTGNLHSKQWGLLVIQEGGRRKPVDTFARNADPNHWKIGIYR